MVNALDVQIWKRKEGNIPIEWIAHFGDVFGAEHVAVHELAYGVMIRAQSNTDERDITARNEIATYLMHRNNRKLKLKVPRPQNALTLVVSSGRV